MSFAGVLADEVADETIQEGSTCQPSTCVPVATKFKIGDFVAVLQEESTLANPSILIGRIQYYVSDSRVELIWYKNRGTCTYSIELDGCEWTEDQDNLEKVHMSYKKGKQPSGLMKLFTSERSLHKTLSLKH